MVYIQKIIYLKRLLDYTKLFSPSKYEANDQLIMKYIQ